LSKSSSLSATESAKAAAVARHRARRRFRPFRLAVLLLVALVALLFEPHAFRFAVRHFIRFEAWRHGVQAQIGDVSGSIYEPVVLRDSIWSYESIHGPVTRLEIREATARFSWRTLLSRSSSKWFRELRVEGVTGKVRFPLAPETAPVRGFTLPLPRLRGRWIPSPERFNATQVDLILQSGADYARLIDAEFFLSSVQPGAIRAGQIVVKEPWLTRTFRDVQGTTAVQNGVVEIAAMTLEPGVVIQDFSAALDDIVKGRVKFAMQLAAFGGETRAEAQTLPEEREFAIDVAAKFSKINVASLATFLGISDAAGGTIKTGNFSFRGPPQQVAKANAQLRLEAGNFQWESRQWDSLVLGAKLIDGRVQIPELALTQGHNRLNLSGEMALPVAGVAWWQSEFSCDLTAKIDNLTELSALMMPEFKFAAGKGNIDGSIRGKDQKFTGQILISGSRLKWRNAPIDDLHASVKLNGNEFQFTNISLFNDGDFVRGRGVVNIIGDKQYWGELHASVENLAKYAAILQKPIVPEPLGGGAIIDWSGEGSAKGHSGTFLARLKKVRTLGATAARLHPINADLEGSYAHGGIVFSKFALSDDTSSFTANVAVVNKALALQGIRLVNKQRLWLEGDALLPLDLWNAWPNTSFATLLDDNTVGKINLTAHDLQLREASQLTGWKFPIEGVLNGNIVAEGPIPALTTSGRITLSKGVLPLGWSGGALTGVDAAFVLDGHTLAVEKSSGRHPTGDFTASGGLDLSNLRDPVLKIAIASEKSTVGLFGFISANSTLRLQIDGPVSGATVSGTATILDATPVAEGGAGVREFESILDDYILGPPPEIARGCLDITAEPWASWRFDVHVLARRLRVRLTPHADGMLDVDARLIGSGPDTGLLGTANIEATGAPDTQATQLHFERAAFVFRSGQPLDPSIDMRASGRAFDEPFAVTICGTLHHPMRVFLNDPPLTARAITDALAGEAAANLFSGERRFSLLVPAELREGVELSDWLPIKAEPATEPTPSAEIKPARRGERRAGSRAPAHGAFHREVFRDRFLPRCLVVSHRGVGHLQARHRLLSAGPRAPLGRCVLRARRVHGGSLFPQHPAPRAGPQPREPALRNRRPAHHAALRGRPRGNFPRAR
jgi:hypothetical protein